MSTVGPRFMMRCRAPSEWNTALVRDLSSITEVFVEDVAGFGWKVEIYSEALKKALLAATDFQQVFVAHIMREDGEVLYLFETVAQREIFEALNSIKGINVNVAATAVAVVGPSLLLQWTQGASTKGYKFAGLGPKSLEKLVYEMQSKKDRFLPLLQSASQKLSSSSSSAQSGSQDPSLRTAMVPPSILVGLEKLGLRPSDTLRIIDEMRASDVQVDQMSDKELVAKILQSWGREKWSSSQSTKGAM